MSISKLTIRPIEQRDSAVLDAHREAYVDADIECLHGYRRSPGVETAICENGKEFVAAMVATQVILFDFIQNAGAYNTDRFAAAIMLERTLAFAALKAGCVDSYVAIPVQLTEYIKQLERCGYGLAATNCVIMRRPLTPDTCPSIGEARDAEVVGPDPDAPRKFIPPTDLSNFSQRMAEAQLIEPPTTGVSFGSFPPGSGGGPPHGN